MPCHTMFFSYCGQLLYSVLFCQQSCCPHIRKQKIKLIYHIFRTCRICDRCCRSYGTCGACGAGWTGCSYWSICTNRTGCTWTPLWPGWACCSRTPLVPGFPAALVAPWLRPDPEFPVVPAIRWLQLLLSAQLHPLVPGLPVIPEDLRSCCSGASLLVPWDRSDPDIHSCSSPDSDSQLLCFF